MYKSGNNYCILNEKTPKNLILAPFRPQFAHFRPIFYPNIFSQISGLVTFVHSQKAELVAKNQKKSNGDIYDYFCDGRTDRHRLTTRGNQDNQTDGGITDQQSERLTSLYFTYLAAHLEGRANVHKESPRTG